MLFASIIIVFVGVAASVPVDVGSDRSRLNLDATFKDPVSIRDIPNPDATFKDPVSIRDVPNLDASFKDPVSI